MPNWDPGLDVRWSYVVTGSNADMEKPQRMNLQSVIKGIKIADRRGKFGATISGVSADSRSVQPGHVFVAVRGYRHDGHDHIPDAVKRGAVAVIAEEWKDSHDEVAREVDVVLVPNTRRVLGWVAANFHNQPSKKLQVAGVTGTNGKTSVTYILESIIRGSGRKVGVVGTVEARYADKKRSLGHTTPGPIELQSFLAEMREYGVTHALLEVSSHALDQRRAAGTHFKVAAFTNLTQDHLDYHGTIDTYFEAKAKLFTEALQESKARGRIAVVNLDDSYGPEMARRWEGKSLLVSLEPDAEADIVVLDAEYTLEGTQARIRTPKEVLEIQTALVGAFNLSNTCVAIGMAMAMGFAKNRIVEGLKALKRVPGRLERVATEDGRMAFVDYAHSPDALDKVMRALRPHTKGRLIVVFGAGGHRDTDKRSLMGEAVGRYADIAFVTTDNPRGEDPAEIASQICVGLANVGFDSFVEESGRGYIVELDRQRSIYAAVEYLTVEDTLVVAGKGHEATQVIDGVCYHFDDREVLSRALTGAPEVELEVETSTSSSSSTDQVSEDTLPGVLGGSSSVEEERTVEAEEVLTSGDSNDGSELSQEGVMIDESVGSDNESLVESVNRSVEDISGSDSELKS